MDKSKQNTEDNHLSAALRRLFRPLIRLLLSRGFTYKRLIQIIRPIYVDLAEQEFQLDSKPVSDSRISLLTGIARRYVKELRQLDRKTQSVTPKISPAAKLVAHWVSLSRYLDDSNQPLVLPRLANQASGPSFEELANLASNDVRPRTLLDNLLERKLVGTVENDQVRLCTQAYRPDTHLEDMIDIFGIHLHDHLAAITRNLASKSSPCFDRSAFQDGLSAKSVKVLKNLVEEEAMKLLTTVYGKAAELASKDENRDNNTMRFRLGVYSYSADEDNENN